MGALVGSDAAIVEQMLAGDPSGLAALYDRYADRIYTMSSHMLRDPDEAADVTSDVFLVAAERIGQLRDPAKVKQWLFAITRNEVYRRSRRRSRTVLVGDVDETVLGGTGLGGAAVDLTDGAVPGEDAPDPADAAALVREAAAGLDDRDRTVLELHLAQGLDGTELAEALGVKVDHAYQLTHRMKERLQRSLGALVVGRAGTADCPDLATVTAKWDGRFDVLWRKRLGRHADRCERCGALRSKLPAAVLAGAGTALLAGQSAMAAPAAVRERVLADAAARLGAARGRAWPGDGFPPVTRGNGRRAVGLFTVGLVLAVLVLTLLTGALGGGDDPVVVDAPSVPSGPSTSAPPGAATTVPVGPEGVATTLPDVVPVPSTTPGAAPGATLVGGSPTPTTSASVRPGTATTVAPSRSGSTAPTTTSAPGSVATSPSTTTTTVAPPSTTCPITYVAACGPRSTTTTTVRLVPVRPRPFPFVTTTLPRLTGTVRPYRPPPTIG